MACDCRCHACVPWQIHRDALASINAVTACARCINDHCAVLSERRIWFDAPQPDAWTDPPRPAEAVTDTGEGEE